MLAFRILHKKYNDPLFAPGIEGRWNSRGRKVLYCSESIPLAFMESMIRRQGVGFNHDFLIAHIEIPDDISIKRVQVKDLETDWDNPHDYGKCQPLADQWYDSLESLLLEVPSSVLSICNNYVINTIHPEYSKIRLIALTPLVPDKRIDEILKRGK